MESFPLILITISVVISIPSALALPTGAPLPACQSMHPQHPGPDGFVVAQNGPSPFRITLDPTPVVGQYKIAVSRNPQFPGTPPMLGFLVQVRTGDQLVGEFVDLPEYARFGDCGGPNAVTHVNAKPKDMIDGPGLQFLWKNHGDAVFQVLGTFVVNMQTFWVKVGAA